YGSRADAGPQSRGRAWLGRPSHPSAVSHSRAWRLSGLDPSDLRGRRGSRGHLANVMRRLVVSQREQHDRASLDKGRSVRHEVRGRPSRRAFRLKLWPHRETNEGDLQDRRGKSVLQIEVQVENDHIQRVTTARPLVAISEL